MSHTRPDHVGAVAKQRQAHHKRWRYVLGIFFTLLIVAGISFLLLYSRMYVTEIQISGFHLSDDVQVREIVTEYLDTKVLGIIPHWHRFLISERKLKKILQKEFPIFSAVTIAETNQILSVNVSERTAQYVWCEKVSATEDRLPTCAYMGSDGLLFEQAPYFSGSTRVTFYGNAPVLGTTAVSVTTIAHVAAYIQLLSKLDFTLQSVYVNEFDIDLVGVFAANRASGVKIIVKPEDDPMLAISYAEVLLRDPEFLKDFKTKPLQYIDARSGKILYYRFDI